MGNPLAMEEMLHIIHAGLVKKNNPKRITIAGAGISGLVAGSFIKRGWARSNDYRSK